MHYIIEKWSYNAKRLYHTCRSLNTLCSFPSGYGHRLRDAEIRTRTGVAYHMQVNDQWLVPSTDTGTRTLVHGHGQVWLALETFFSPVNNIMNVNKLKDCYGILRDVHRAVYFIINGVNHTYISRYSSAYIF